MESVLEQALNLPLLLEQLRGEDGLAHLLLQLFPLFLVVELPLTLMVILGVLQGLLEVCPSSSGGLLAATVCWSGHALHR